jgi:hypothetical protein
MHHHTGDGLPTEISEGQVSMNLDESSKEHLFLLHGVTDGVAFHHEPQDGCWRSTLRRGAVGLGRQ